MPGVSSQGFYDQTMNPYAHSGQSSGSDFFSQFKFPNPWVTLGSQGLGGVLKLLGGKSWGEKKREDLYGFLDTLKGRPLINPNMAKQFQPQIEQSLIPFLNSLGKSGAGKVGLDSGVYTGEALRQGSAGLSAQLLPIMQRIMEINATAPLDISRLQAGLV